MRQEYQKVYEVSVLQELIGWFKQRLDRLPTTSLRLNSGFVVNNVDYTVRTYIEIVEFYYQRPAFGAQILHLFRIREKLIEMGFE